MFHPDKIRIFIISLILLTTGHSQSIMNGYGFGAPLQSRHASSLGSSSLGLVPVFQNGVAIDNPATWPDLSFTFLTGSYGGQTIANSSYGNTQGESVLDEVHLVIPVKQKWAIGFALVPFSNRTLEVFDTGESLFIQGTDTLSMTQTRSTEGGIDRAQLGFGIRGSERANLGLAISLIFGSDRMVSGLRIDDTDYVQNRRFIYSGLLMELDGTYNYDLQSDQTLTLYGRIGFPLIPLEIEQQVYYPFEDANESGINDDYHDIYDFPNPALTPGPELSTIKNVYAPIALQVGTDWQTGSRLHWTGELSLNHDQSPYQRSLYLLDDRMVSASHMALGVVRFPKKVPRDFFGHLILRAGLYNSIYHYENRSKSVIENGVSSGIGIKFGTTGNQIDIGYSYGIRTGLPTGNETLQRLSVGVSIGDIWFVKRREL